MFYPVTQSGRADKRYRVALEYTGAATGRPQYVARFCDEFIGSSAFRSSAAMLAIGHNARRMGAAVIVESRA